MSEEDRLGPVANYVAERVGEARAHARLTQKQVVDRLAEQGVSMLKTTLSKVENSQRGIAVDELVALATALNVSVLDLLPPECATSNGSGPADDETALAVHLRHITSDLDGYLERRAAELAAPRIAEVEAAAQRRIEEAEAMVVRAHDLVAELRRMLTTRDNQLDDYHVRLGERRDPFVVERRDKAKRATS